MTKNFRVIIPARYASTRLPAKALCSIAGKPMVQHVYERACQSDAISVVVATDDSRIVTACEKFGAVVCLTSSHHLSGTDRIAEVTTLLNYDAEDIIVNAQGDQPLIHPDNINQTAQNLILHEEVNIATLAEIIHDTKDLHHPAVPKVVLNHLGHALYFSRSLIPWHKTVPDDRQIYYKHIGLYAYRVKTIQQFVHWKPSDLELSESLEQLRFLSYGEKIHVDLAVRPALLEVNTPEDLEKIRDIISQDLI